MKDKDSDGSCNEIKKRTEPADFKSRLNLCLMPFDFAGDDDFDVLAMQ